MTTAAIAIGGNVGDVPATLARAVKAIGELPGTGVRRVSSLYRTPPVGGPVNADGSSAQPDFLNGALVVDTSLSPEKLMDALLAIEAGLGRVRGVQDGPRTVDLDLVLWEGLTMDTPKVILPHPRMHERGFVLAPLAEIAPELVHPVIGKTVGELLAALPETGVGFMRLEFRPEVPA